MPLLQAMIDPALHSRLHHAHEKVRQAHKLEQARYEAELRGYWRGLGVGLVVGVAVGVFLAVARMGGGG